MNLIGISPLVIIFGGTIGATMLSFTIDTVLKIPTLIQKAATLTPELSRDSLEMMITFAEKARREGILSLEEEISDLSDPFLAKGLKLAVDGTDPDMIRAILENDIYLYELRDKEEAAVFDTMGGFSPTMGIIGTVMGLVLVLGNLGGNAESLGHSIAVAFIATLYGIGLANLLWLPIGNKLKLKAKKEKLQREMIVFSVLSLLAGENPSVLRDKLESYLTEKDQKEFKQTEPKASEF